MLTLPLIAPRADASLWPSHHLFHAPPDAEPSPHSPPNTHTNAPQRHAHHSHHARATTAFLHSLTHDENTIDQRKQNVRRFGSGWLRPPGVAKTLQALRDEELEKEEQEMMARREQVMLDLAAAQQEAANEQQRVAGEERDGDGAGEGGEEGERDLDDSVPEAASLSDSASASGSASDDDDDDDSDTAGGSDDDEEQETASQTASASITGTDTSVPFNEDSFIEGSILEAEVSHMLEMEEAEIAGVLQDERDLDDSIPEAGEYEHTDSELEPDTDSEVDISGLSSARRRPPRRRSSALRSRRSSGLASRRSSGLPPAPTSTRRASGLHATVTAGARRSSGLPAGMMGVYATAGTLDLGASLGHGRSSFGMDGSSLLDGSSFLRSSPAATAARVSLRERFLNSTTEGGTRGGRGRRE
ncbi:hypothetical protein P153DRAFT_397186 [Dothidotthia symphoricarpi CBS 119687]|uniref:Uncharacterized protein n=1 Tax=Dothidotthia symphoricarpi CBS 119687 TaxID=1392245 RepID=A0A6A6ACY9_9PLEO|nr:uncharacterized protein P153DRAFT_397186 [Dothidotthia symphoricarpi CBS 119687]KAF2128985.1 hypothetical protein P153DRAFT_397186 [Dothidotthia symphoricarpi CBS 119687]